MARYAVNRKFQILYKKVNRHLIHDPQLQQHRVRLGATVLWLFQACSGIGGTSNSLKFSFPTFSSPIYALLAAASTSQYIYLIRRFVV